MARNENVCVCVCVCLFTCALVEVLVVDNQTGSQARVVHFVAVRVPTITTGDSVCFLRSGSLY